MEYQAEDYFRGRPKLLIKASTDDKIQGLNTHRSHTVQDDSGLKKALETSFIYAFLQKLLGGKNLESGSLITSGN